MKTKKKKRATQNVSTKVRPMTAPESGVKVRMYRQGLGDCFLLAFPGDGQKPFYMLIDCGVLVGQVPGRPNIKEVAEHIAASTGKRLDVIVATHQHWDHLSGFIDAADVFGDIQIGEAWLAWTENPTDSLAKRLAQKSKGARMAIDRTLAHLTSGRTSAMSASDNGWLGALGNVFGFLGADTKQRTTEAALKTLRALCSGRVKYCAPTDEPIALPGEKNARVYVLGPPHDEQKIKSYNDKKSDPQTYHLAEMALAAQVDFLVSALDDQTGESAAFSKDPFDVQHQIKKGDAAGLYGRLSKRWLNGNLNAWRGIPLDWLRAITGLALDLDNATNNTSLAIAIELGERGKVLLFPADAQVGNWLSWRDQSWKDVGGKQVTVEDILARTVLYKVGHHCSHNATLRQHGLELMANKELIAMVPLDRATAKKKKWPMPWPKLRANLLEATKGRMLQVDDEGLPSELPVPAGCEPAVWKEFQKAVTGDESYFEVTISS
jgi:hypothetical protein